MRANLPLTGLAAGVTAVALLGIAAPVSAAPGIAKPKIVAVHTIPGKSSAEDVACPPGKPVTKETCTIVGDEQAGNTQSLVHHGKPGAAKPVSPGGGHVTCPSATVCVVAGAESLSTAPGGVVGTVQWLTSGTPTATVVVNGTSNLTGVACTSATRCIAAGQFNGKVTSNGTKQYGEVAVVTTSSTTAHAHRVAKTEDLSSVACTANKSCVVVGFGGSIAKHHGVVVGVKNAHIGSARPAPGVGQFTEVSCGSSTTCWATGLHSSATKGVTGVVAKVKHAKAAHALKAPQDAGAIACVSASTCYLGGGKLGKTGQTSTGEVFVMVNGHIKKSKLVKHTMGFSGISCPTRTSCLVTGLQTFHNPGPSSFWRSDMAVVKL